MNVSAISSSGSTGFATMLANRASVGAGELDAAKTPNAGRDPAAIKKAVGQFEAIILRQLLAPTIEPVMSGGMGGGGDASSGIYGYMLTDTLANSLSQGGGLGLARMLEKQLTPRGAAPDVNGSDLIRASTPLKPLKLP